MNWYAESPSGDSAKTKTSQVFETCEVLKNIASPDSYRDRNDGIDQGDCFARNDIV